MKVRLVPTTDEVLLKKRMITILQPNVDISYASL